MELELSADLQSLSHELARLTAGLALPPRRLDAHRQIHREDDSGDDDEGDDDKEEAHHQHHIDTTGSTSHQPSLNRPWPSADRDDALKLIRQKAQRVRLQNSEGAVCWKKSCRGTSKLEKGGVYIIPSFSPSEFAPLVLKSCSS